jgi:hypothetical protein
MNGLHAVTVTFDVILGEPLADAAAVIRGLALLGEPLEPGDLPEVFEHRGLRMQGEVLGARVRLTAQIHGRTAVDHVLTFVHDLAAQWGGEVALTEVEGERRHVTDRAALWITLADVRDRLRLFGAIEADPAARAEVLAGLWGLLQVWGTAVELRYVPDRGRIVAVRLRRGRASTTETEDTEFDALDTPEHQAPLGTHLVAWRWLEETWPSLTEGWQPR